jgi:hypothetical protein
MAGSSSATAGQQARAAVELGAEIVNGNYPDLAGSALAGSAGLPNLKNARVQIITANDQGIPAVGEKQTARLINEERVVAVQGSYASSVTLAASTVAEQSRVPFMAGNSTAANITARGFEWIFRVTSHATDFAKTYMTSWLISGSPIIPSARSASSMRKAMRSFVQCDGDQDRQHPRGRRVKHRPPLHGLPRLLPCRGQTIREFADAAGPGFEVAPSRSEIVHRPNEGLGAWTLWISDRHKSKIARRAMRIIGSVELGTVRAT